MEKRETVLQKRIAQALRFADYEYEAGPALGGVRPDFIVYGPEGRTVVVEAKGWTSGGGRIARARDQAQWYKEITGADDALIVLWESKRNYHLWGVHNLNGLVPALQRVFKQTRPLLVPSIAERTSPERMVFAAMPFEREYDDTFFVAMTDAAAQVNATCKRVDREEFSGDIVEEIKRLIEASVGVIADLSESKPNVLLRPNEEYLEVP